MFLLFPLTATRRDDLLSGFLLNKFTSISGIDNCVGLGEPISDHFGTEFEINMLNDIRHVFKRVLAIFQS